MGKPNKRKKTQAKLLFFWPRQAKLIRSKVRKYGSNQVMSIQNLDYSSE
jgi:hypothetical protein